jgi:hypothetical protein
LGLSSIFHCGLLRELSVRKLVSGSGAALNWIFGPICTSFWSKRDSIYFLGENAGRSQYSVGVISARSFLAEKILGLDQRMLSLNSN